MPVSSWLSWITWSNAITARQPKIQGVRKKPSVTGEKWKVEKCLADTQGLLKAKEWEIPGNRAVHGWMHPRKTWGLPITKEMIQLKTWEPTCELNVCRKEFKASLGVCRQIMKRNGLPLRRTTLAQCLSNCFSEKLIAYQQHVFHLREAQLQNWTNWECRCDSSMLQCAKQWWRYRIPSPALWNSQEMIKWESPWC